MALEILLISMVAGFVAQLIDGSLGMGYGVILSLLLFSLGMPPVTVSASVHMAKLVASGASGYAHLKFGNVNRAITTKLATGGVIGAVLGATVLRSAPAEVIKPVVAVYLVVMGLMLVYKSLHRTVPREKPMHIEGLGAVGGFCDAIGGGGWGPIVTPSMLVRGKNPRTTIGSVSLAEFFVAITVLTLLISEVPQLLTQVQMLGGLILGSVAAAPIAAYVSGKIAHRPLLLAAGSLVIALSVSTVIATLVALLN